MKKFKSSIFESVMAKIIRNVMLVFLLYLVDLIFNFSGAISINISLFQVLSVYFILFLIQIYVTNNDLIVTDKELIIQSSLFQGIRKKTFKKEEIKEIIFKDEWSESFMGKNTSIWRFIILHFLFYTLIPWEYKWIRIITSEKKNHTFYFFGLNYDFFDNSQEILFEDMFIELAKNNIKVKWKSMKNKYFEEIQETADKFYFGLNK